jgi:hypothetical protein
MTRNATFKVLLIVGIIAVCLGSGIFYYTQITSKPVVSSTSQLKAAEFFISNLTINPSELEVGQPVKVTVNVTNLGQQDGNYSVDIRVNNAYQDSKVIELSGGQNTTVAFTLTESNSGTYAVSIGNLTSTFKVEAIVSTPQPSSTPNRPPISSGGGVSGGSSGTNGPRSWTSCPSLLIWNGTSYKHASEVSDGPGWLGFVDHYNSDGSILFAYSNPWSYMKINPNSMQSTNGYYNMAISEQSDEIFYLDSVKLLTIDHSPNVDVYSTRGTYLYNLSNQGTIYTIGKNLAPPVSATNNGKNVLPQISKIDGNSTVATRWTWNTLDLNLGNLAGISQIKLLINAQTNWPTNEAGGNWATQFSNQPGITPSPPPYMEVKDARGNWVKVPDNREFPIPPVDPSSFTVNLTGLFQTNDYSLRICYYQDYTFDYIGVDITRQQSVIIQEILPQIAALGQAFGTNSNSSGSFTRYGNVDNLVLAADDKYMIGRQGDSVQLEFAKAAPVPDGMVRDYFIVASCWFKGQGLPYVPFTVDSLPFYNMTGYPYPSTEKYTMDPSHISYLSQYNTRIINTTKTDSTGQMASVVHNQIDILKLLVTSVSFLVLVDCLSISSTFRLKK